MSTIATIAERLIAAYDTATMLAPITTSEPDFDIPAAYEVLAEIGSRRRAQGWEPVGRKIGFTNRTIWERYGVSVPMWAPVWAHTVHFGSRISLPLRSFVQPRIEPEVVFKLKAPVPVTDDPVEVLSSVEWIAAGFEIVQSHFPGWRFTAADCTAAFGLHGALVVGEPVVVDDCEALAAALPVAKVTLSRNGIEVDRGVGADVLGSPALALAHLAHVLAGQPRFPDLRAGEIVTTGTVTDAWPIEPGQTWTSDYGALELGGLRVELS